MGRTSKSKESSTQNKQKKTLSSQRCDPKKQQQQKQQLNEDQQRMLNNEELVNENNIKEQANPSFQNILSADRSQIQQSQTLEISNSIQEISKIQKCSQDGKQEQDAQQFDAQSLKKNKRNKRIKNQDANFEFQQNKDLKETKQQVFVQDLDQFLFKNGDKIDIQKNELSTLQQNFKEGQFDQIDQCDLNNFLNQNLSQSLEGKEQNQKKTRKYTRRQNKKKKSEKDGDCVNNALNSLQLDDKIDMDIEQNQNKKKIILRKKKQNISEDSLCNDQQKLNEKDIVNEDFLNLKPENCNTDQIDEELDLNSKQTRKQVKRNKRKKIEYDDGESPLKEVQDQQNLHVNEQEQDKVFELCKDIFPHENPYPSQIDSMKKIVETLKNKKNLLFQSPTGTGKTLMTISSALAYVQNNPNTKILLLTRTCEQINGFIKEIRKIKKYEKINQYAILAGRNQFCPKFNQIKKYFKEKETDIKLSNEDVNKLCALITKYQQEEDEESEKDEEDKVAGLKDKIQNKNIQHKMKIINILGISNQNQNTHEVEKFINELQLFKQIQKIQEPENESNQSNEEISREIEKDKILLDELESRALKKEQNNFYLLQNNEETELHDTTYNPDNEQLDYCEHFQHFKVNISKNKNIKWRYPKVKRNTQQEFMLPDIEDINDLFQDKKLGCPYFYNKEAAKSAKIVYSTYNYVIKQHILSRVKNLFENSRLIVIFDEGHNVAEIAEQELKVTLSKDHWDTFYETVKKLNSFFQKSKLNNEENIKLKQLIANEIENEAQYFKILIQSQSKRKEKQNSQEDQDKKHGFNLIKEKLSNEKENEESGKQYLKQKNFSYTDLYDQIKSCIQNRYITIKRDDLKDLVDFIQKKELDEQESDEQKISQNLEMYKKARKEELFSFLHNFQNKFLDISEICENNFISWFNPQNNKNQNFSELFYGQNIYNHLQKLEFVDILQMKEFVNKSQEVYINLIFIKALIENEDSKKNTEQTFDPISSLVIISKDINVDSFKSINKFFKRLLFLRKEQEINNKSQTLLDYYLCFSRDNQSLYFQIGCLSAKEIFEKIKQKIHVDQFIFSSGTLQPFNLITNSVGLDFEEYESKNIFNSQENLFTQIVTEYQEKEINFSYDKKEIIIFNAINAIQDILNIFLIHTRKLNKKQGFLIFFKNYSYLNQYYKEIRNIVYKQFYVYKETNDSQEFKQQFESFKKNIETNTKNCIFLGVCKGKLSEGIDMKDNLCRIVILLGVPYPQLFDPYVNCQRKRYKIKFMINDWYEQVTSKVINQAAGRCIRHKNDWGCIFFLDNRFSDKKIQKNISGWILDGQKQKEDEQIISNDWQNLFKAFLGNITNKIELKNYQK